MINGRPNRDSMSIEEATISSRWEMVAILEVLERKGETIEMRQWVTKGMRH